MSRPGWSTLSRAEVLEDRALLSAFSASGSTLNIDLAAGESLQIVSAGTSYTLTSSGTWSGTTNASVTTSGSVLTVTSAGLTNFNTINVTDSGDGAAVTFNNSGANAYGDSFNITLDNAAPGAVTLNGTSTFSGSAALSASANSITVSSGATLTTNGGSIGLTAANGVSVSGSINTSGGSLTVNADSDANGTGTFSVAAGVGNVTPVSASGTGTFTGNVSSLLDNNSASFVNAVGSNAVFTFDLGATHTLTALMLNNGAGQPGQSMSRLDVTFLDSGMNVLSTRDNFAVSQAEGSLVRNVFPSPVENVRFVRFSDMFSASDVQFREIKLEATSVSGQAISTGAGNVTMAAADVDLQGAVTGTGTVTIRPSQPSRAITLGTETAGSLSLTDTELDRISAAGSIQVGDASSGTVTVGGALTTATNLSLSTGAGIAINQPITMAADKNFSATSTSTTSGISLPNSASDITASGTGSVSLSTLRNVSLSSGSSIATVNGGITVFANFLGLTSGNFFGISLNGATVESTGTGGIALFGGGGSDAITSSHHGVVLNNSAMARATGSGSLTIIGYGGTSNGSSSGVLLTGGSTASTVSGNLTITGNGGSGAGNDHHGVNLVADSIAQVASGRLSVTGTATTGNSRGIRLSDDSGGRLLSSGSGEIVITADGNGTLNDFGAGADSIVGGPAATGPITINADSIVLSGTASVRSTGTLTIQPRTASTTIGIGGGAGTLNLSDSELELLSDGFSSITIGDASSGTGAVDVNSSTFNDNVTIVGGSVSVTELNAGANNVSLTARTGAISDGGDAGTDIIGGAVSLFTPTGIGANGDDLSLAATSLTTSTFSGNAAQYFSETDTVAITGNSAGTGTITLSGGEFDMTSSPFGANTKVVVASGATLDVNGNSDTLGSLTVSGGTLKGAGTLTAAVSMTSGSLSPGNAVGVINAKKGLSLTGGTLTASLAGNGGAGNSNGFDQLNVTGTVTLGATLAIDTTGLTAGEIGAGEQTYLLIANDSTDALTGTFSGLAEGATVVSNIAGTGRDLKISYKGNGSANSGTGNDVLLFIPAALATPSLSASLVNGALVVEDTDTSGKANQLTLSRSGTNIVLSDVNEQFTSSIAGATLSNGNKTITIPVTSLATVTKILVKGQGGSDSLSVDVLDGSTNLGFDVEFQGGTGTSDSLTLLADTVTSVTHTFTNANDGSIMIAQSNTTRTVSYTGLEPIADNLTATNRVFTFNGGAETITLSDAAGAAMTIDSTLSESVTFLNPTGTLTINSGTGNDVVQVTSVDAAFATTLTINGDADNDTVQFLGDITAASGMNLSINAESFSTGTNADLMTSGNGVITITADDIALDPTSTLVTSSTSTVTLKPQTASRAIDLGTNASSKLSLTDAELDRITTGTLVVGDSVSGAITISADISPANTRTLSLRTGSTVTGTAGGIVVSNLAISADKSINITDSTTNVGTLATTVFVGNVTFKDSDAITIGLVAGVTGVQGGLGGNVTITTAGPITATQAISAFRFFSGGNVTLTGADGSSISKVNTFDGTWTVAGGEFSVGSNAVEDTASVVISSGGTLRLNGATDTLSQLTVSGGTLKGTGTLTAPVSMTSGNLAPGATTPGVINTGNLNLTGGTFAADLTGNAGAGVSNGHDQLNVTGSVSLSGLTLSLSTADLIAAEVPVGQRFVLINNDESDADSGTFRGLPEGATVLSNVAGSGRDVKISYVGGSGNDVELTVVAVVVPTTEVKLVGNDLVIEDVAGGNSNDQLTLTVSGSSLVVSDASAGVQIDATGTLSGAAGDLTGSVTIPLSNFSGNVIVNTLAGNDSITVNGLNLGDNRGLTINGGDGTDSTIFATGSTTLSGTATLTVESETLAVGASVALGSGAAILTADNIAVNANLSGTGALTLKPATASRSIGVGTNATGDFHLESTELGQLQNGFSSITIGDAVQGTGAVDVDASAFQDAVTIAGGAITVAELNAGSNAVTLTARTGAITDGGDTGIDIVGGAVTLNAVNGTIGTSSDALSLAAGHLNTNTSAANGAQFLSELDSVRLTSINAGSGTLTMTGGQFDLGSDSVANTTKLKVATGAVLNINGASDVLSLVTVNGGAIQGSGTIQSATELNSGDLALGTSPIVVNTGNLNLAGGVFNARVLGNGEAGNSNGFDQLNVSGTVTLNNSKLTLSTLALPNSDGLGLIKTAIGRPVSQEMLGTAAGSMTMYARVRFSEFNGIDDIWRLGDARSNDDTYALEFNAGQARFVVTAASQSTETVVTHSETLVVDRWYDIFGVFTADPNLGDAAAEGSLAVSVYDASTGQPVGTTASMPVSFAALRVNYELLNALFLQDRVGSNGTNIVKHADQAAVWNRALSAAEIAQIPTSDAVAFWNFASFQDTNGGQSNLFTIDNQGFGVRLSDLTPAEVAGLSTIVLINNDGSDAVTGTFANLPEGATVLSNVAGTSLKLKISYRGGDGNDVVLSLPSSDFGDAPDTGAGTGTGNYETTNANGGPSHDISSTQTTLFLGATVDREDDAIPGDAAFGDDFTAFDEDGTTGFTVFAGADAEVSLRATNLTGSGARLYGWIDFNRNGVFDATERAEAAVNSGTNNGTITLRFPGNANSVVGKSYARFRLSSDAAAANPTGSAQGGEVEDYVVTISTPPSIDYGDAPDSGPGTSYGNYETKLASNGPRHIIVPGLFLGSSVDVDGGSLQDAAASSDDSSGSPNDEDGVQGGAAALIATELTAPRITFKATNTTAHHAKLYGWIDYNRDGVFDNLTERTDATVPNFTENGSFTLTFPNIPRGSAGLTIARFRLSYQQFEASQSIGLANSGEVEDYVFTINAAPPVPRVSFLEATRAITEADGQYQIGVTLDAPATEFTLIPLTFTGSATSGTDYFPPFGSTVPFHPGDRTVFVTGNLVDDTDFEQIETIRVGFGTLTGAELSTRAGAILEHTMTLAASDGNTVEFTSNGFQAVSESAGTVTLNAKLIGTASSAVSIPLVIGGTASSPGDYTLSATTLTFPANTADATASITVTIANDTAIEPRESITFRLGNPTGPAFLGSQQTVQFDVVDDDSPVVEFVPTPSNQTTVWENDSMVSIGLRLSQPMSGPVDVVIEQLPKSGNATAASDFTMPATVRFDAGQTTATLPISLINDNVNETLESILLQIRSVSTANGHVSVGLGDQHEAFIRDDDPTVSIDVYERLDEGMVGRFNRISLSSETNRDVQVLLSAFGTATFGTDYTVTSGGQPIASLVNVTIPAGERSYLFDINVLADSVAEQPETLTFSIGSALPVSVSQSTLKIRDAAPEVNFAGSSFFKKRASNDAFTEVEGQTFGNIRSFAQQVFYKENVGTLTIYVSLGKTVAQDVTIPLTYAGSAKQSMTTRPNFAGVLKTIDDRDYEPGPGSVTIRAGQTEASFTLNILNDDETEGSDDLRITLGTPSVSGVERGTSSTIEILLSDERNPDMTLPLTLAGNAYLAGSTMFFDANRNGVLDFLDADENGVQDEGEPSEPFAATGADGGAPLRVGPEFDLDGNGVLDSTDGIIVVTGGIDTATGLPLPYSLTGYFDTPVISPLTTLLTALVEEQGFTVGDAADRIAAAFGLLNSRFTELDPLAGVQAGDGDAPAIFVTRSMVNSTLTEIATALSGAPDTPPLTFIAGELISDFAERLAGQTEPFNLQSDFAIEALVRGTLTRIGATLSDEVIAGIAQVIAVGNQRIASIPLATTETFLDEVVRTKQVSQGNVAAALRDAVAGIAPINDVIAAFTGAALETQISNAEVGVILPPSLSIASAELVEGDEGVSELVFTVSISEAPSQQVTVSYATSDNSATVDDGDYSETSGLLIWVAGDATPKTFSVAINGDTNYEPNEFLAAILSDPINGILSDAVATGTLINDDALNVFVPPGPGEEGTGSRQTSLRLAGTLLELATDGETIVSQQASSTSPITITGTHSADDTLVVNMTSGSPIPAEGLIFHGGAGAVDTAEVLGGEFDSITQSLTNANDGITTFAPAGSGSTQSFQWFGLEPFLLNVGSVTDLVFELPNGGVTAILEDADPTDENPALAGMMQLRSPDGDFETTIFAEPGGSLTIRGGDGDDSITIASVDPAFSADLTIDGRDGADHIDALAATGTGTRTLLAETIQTPPPPSVTAIDRSDASPTSNESVSFFVTFSEEVTRITAGDFVLATTGSVSGSISGVSAVSGTTVTIVVSSITGEGTLGLNFDADADGGVLNGLGLTSVADFTGTTYEVDHTSPVAVIDSSETPPTSADAIPFTVTFNEPVTGFEAADLVISGGTVSGFTGSGSDYAFSVVPNPSAAEVTVSVYFGAAQDEAGNDSATATSFSIERDQSAWRPADGATIDTFTQSGAPANSLVTVAARLDADRDGTTDIDLAIVSVDQDPTTPGIQVRASDSGAYSFDIRRPSATGTATYRLTDSTGAVTQLMESYDPVNERRFDFNAPGSATQAPVSGSPEVAGEVEVGGYIGVRQSDQFATSFLGYGWDRMVDYVFNPATTGGEADLLRDAHAGNAGEGPSRFSAQIENGTYLVTVRLGNPLGSAESMRIDAEGTTVVTGATVLNRGERSDSFLVTVTDGVLDLDMQSTGGTLWAIKGLTIIHQPATGGVTITTALGDVSGNGVTIDTISGLARPGSLVTVSSTLGTIATADAHAGLPGHQVQTDATGNFSFGLRRPASSGSPTIVAESVDGSGAAASSAVVNYIGGGDGTESGTFFDFGAGADQSGFTSITKSTMYSAAAGYGWSAGTLDQTDRGALSGTAHSDLLRDMVQGSEPATFRADLASGDYDVTVLFAAGTNMNVAVTSGAVMSGLSNVQSVTVAAGQVAHRSLTVSVINGHLDLQFSTTSGGPWQVAGLIIRPLPLGTMNVTGPGGILPADGSTTDTFALTGLETGRTYTLTASAGTLTGLVDADSRLAGTQIVAATSSLNVTLVRPATAADVRLAAADVFGFERSSFTQTYEAPAARRFDFNTPTSPTAAGFTGTGNGLWTTGASAGWVGRSPTTYNFAATAGPATIELYQDGVVASEVTFRIAVTPGQQYDARIYVGYGNLTTQVQVQTEHAAAAVPSTWTTNGPVLLKQNFNTITLSNLSDVNGDGYIDLYFAKGPKGYQSTVSGIDFATAGNLPGAAQQASTAGSGAEAVTLSQVQTIVSAAIERFAQAGLSEAALAHLRTVTVEVRDLDGQTLGLGTLNRIIIDDDAAGVGWFVDSTPLDDSEFETTLSASERTASSGQAAIRYDLLSTVMHELGHSLGLVDLDVAHSLMNDELRIGTRRTADIDSIFAGNAWVQDNG